MTPYRLVWQCELCKKPATCSECAGDWRTYCAYLNGSLWCPHCRAGKLKAQEYDEVNDEQMAAIERMMNEHEVPVDPHAAKRRRARLARE